MKKPKGKRLARSLYYLFLAVLLLLSNFVSFGSVEAAKPDKKAPSVPNNLQVKNVTETSLELTWNASTDNIQVTEYYIYQDNRYIGSVPSTQFFVENLRSNTLYTFYIKARDASGNLSNSSNSIQVTTKDSSVVDLPPKVSEIIVSPIADDGRTINGTVTISVDAVDDYGISKVEFYSSNGGYLIRTVTSAPYAVNWTTDPWVPDGEQILKVLVYDSANQISQVSRTLNVKNTTTPVQKDYKMVGYYAGWSTYSGFQVSNIDASKLTHLNYAFANISPDGKIALGDSWADVEKPFTGDVTSQPFKGNFNQFIKLKEQYPHLKTLISVGGWTWSERFSDVALTKESRTIFAQSALEFMIKYGFDGIDLDWEYPVGGGLATNINRPEDKQNFTLLLKEIRETLDAQSAIDGKHYLLTIAAGAGKHHAANLELDLIHQYVDYVQLMTYDFHGSWDAITGMNAPLYLDPETGFYSGWSIHDAIKTYTINGTPAEKIVMGLPFYGRVFNQVNTVNEGLYQSYTGGGTSVSYADIETNYLNKNGFIRYWELDSKVPWLFNGTTFVSYDDVESIGYKTDYIQSNGLGGAMMWELSQDPNKVLLTKIYNDFR